MTEQSVTAHVGVSNQFRYKLEIMRDGRAVSEAPFRDNMLTDFGLDDIATNGQGGWLMCLNSPRLGNGVSPCPIRRDSGAITFTQSGTTLTANSTFFVAGDTGKLFKFGTGSSGLETYLTYVSGTQCTTSTSATVSTPTIGTIWYVDQSALTGYISELSWSNDSGADKNFSSASVLGDTVTIMHQKVFNSSAFGSGTSVTEIGFNIYYSRGNNLYDLDIVNPPVAFMPGDQARVTIQLIQTISGITPFSVSNVGTGYDSSGTAQIESTGLLDGLIQHVDSSGNVTGQGQYDPQDRLSTVFVFRSAGFTPLQSFNANQGGVYAHAEPGYATQSSWTADSYGTGNHYRDVVALFDISTGNGTIYAVSFGGSYRGYTIIFNTPFTKTSMQTLRFTFRKSWSRVLVN